VLRCARKRFDDRLRHGKASPADEMLLIFDFSRSYAWRFDFRLSLSFRFTIIFGFAFIFFFFFFRHDLFTRHRECAQLISAPIARAVSVAAAATRVRSARAAMSRCRNTLRLTLQGTRAVCARLSPRP